MVNEARSAHYTLLTHPRTKEVEVPPQDTRFDLLSEENMKYKKVSERNIILEKETKDLKTELDSLAEVIRILQTEKSSAKVNAVRQTKDNSQDGKVQTKKNHN